LRRRDSKILFFPVSVPMSSYFPSVFVKSSKNPLFCMSQTEDQEEFLAIDS